MASARVKPLALLGAIATSALAAFFLVFRTLFTDGPRDPFDWQYLLAHGLTAAGYGAGAWFWTWRRAWHRLGVALVFIMPALALVVAYGDADADLRALTGTSATLGALVGAFSAEVRKRRAKAAKDGSKSKD